MQNGSKAKGISQAHSSLSHEIKKGLKIERRFTKPGVNPLDQVQYEKRSSAITNKEGSILFKI